MYAFAHARLGRAEEAEDAVQEALVAAWRGRDDFDGRSKESTWLIGILRHKVLDQLRRRTRESDWRRELENELVAGRDCWCDAVARADQRKAWAPPERGTAERQELRRELEAAIETLPFVMRSAFLLGEIDGVPSRSICEILGITPDHLWTLRHRARVRLRRALDRSLQAERADGERDEAVR